MADSPPARTGSAGAGAPAPAPPPAPAAGAGGAGVRPAGSPGSSSPRARLVLLTNDPLGSNAVPIPDEVVIYCRAGAAYAFAKAAYHVIGLEVDGVRTPLLSSERVVAKIFDERDPLDGARWLNRPGMSVAPWRASGLAYFRAVEWRQVGQYRLTFKLASTKRFDGGAAVAGLTFVVVATDPGESMQAGEQRTNGRAG
jgi:hypothetical protein